jgi:hypothetical protein
MHSGRSHPVKFQSLFLNCRGIKVNHSRSKRQLTECYPAIEASWNAEFVDRSPLQALVERVRTQLDNDGDRYCSIVQSSGMGKSRLVDELSKSLLVIPINLRKARSAGLSSHCFI